MVTQIKLYIFLFTQHARSCLSLDNNSLTAFSAVNDNNNKNTTTTDKKVYVCVQLRCAEDQDRT